MCAGIFQNSNVIFSKFVPIKESFTTTISRETLYSSETLKNS